jgi:hypothetical protein
LVVAVRIHVSQPSSLVSLEILPKRPRKGRSSRRFCIHSEPETGKFSDFRPLGKGFSLPALSAVPSPLYDFAPRAFRSMHCSPSLRSRGESSGCRCRPCSGAVTISSMGAFQSRRSRPPERRARRYLGRKDSVYSFVISGGVVTSLRSINDRSRLASDGASKRQSLIHMPSSIS